MERLSIQEALDYCLENPEGLGAQELLDKFPQYREELQPLLGLAQQITTELVPPPLGIGRREAMKARLVAASAQAIKPIQAPETLPVPARKPEQRRPSRPLPWFLRPTWVPAAAAILLIAFVWWSSARALPGSPFYTIKLASENIILTMTGDPEIKALRHTDIANARLYDLRTVQEQGTLAQAGPALDSYSRNVTAANNILQGMPAGDARDRVTEAIYKTCFAGRVILGSISGGGGTLPPNIRDSIQRIVGKVGDIENSASQALISGGKDPQSVLIGSDIAPLLTPVVTTQGVTPTPIVALTAEPTIPAGTTRTIPATDGTPTPFPTLLPYVTGTPTSPVATKTVAPILPPTATYTPEPAHVTPTTIPPVKPSSTPTANKATATPVPAKPTSTPTATRTANPNPTRPLVLPSSTPTNTLVPTVPGPTATSTPSSTATLPVAPDPTDTALSLPTRLVIPSSTPPEPFPSPTKAGETGTVCDLTISRVETQCEGDKPSRAEESCLTWAATVHNPGQARIEADWQLELQIRTGSGGFHTVLAETGYEDFGPGDTEVGDTLCYGFPEGTSQFRVKFTVLTTGYPCQPQSKQSAVEDPCGSD
ncbi:MAG: DUF5667 domain-containing protein [Chloroflexia bacterium]